MITKEMLVLLLDDFDVGYSSYDLSKKYKIASNLIVEWNRIYRYHTGKIDSLNLTEKQLSIIEDLKSDKFKSQKDLLKHYKLSKSSLFQLRYMAMKDLNEVKNSFKNVSNLKKTKIENGLIRNKKSDNCKICGCVKCERPEICKKHRLFPTLGKYFGMNLSKLGTIDIYREYELIKLKLQDMYNDEMSLSEICKESGYKDPRNLNKVFSSMGISLRSLNESIFVAHKKGTISINVAPKYKNGWHTTWDGKNVFYRSSYELNYAKRLDEIREPYEMESLRIVYWDFQKLKFRIAVPDFYLPRINKIVEIKSKFTYDELNMRDRELEYKKLGYDFELRLDVDNTQDKDYSY